MRRAIHITPKQLRTLTGLFIFLPLVPIAFFGWLTFKSNQVIDQEVTAAMRDLHGEYLPGLISAMPSETEDPVLMKDYFLSVLPAGTGLRIVDRGGGILAEGGAPFGPWGATLSEPLPSTYGRWKLQLASLPGTVGHEHPGVGREMRGQVQRAYLVLVVLLAAASAAGIAVFRGLKLEALKNDTLTAISHELKTPVASMRLLLETLRDRGVDDREQVAEYLDLMLQENERVSHMVEDFLN
ncbi:MAG: histidine kinase dimerization/phospho-acceptor domain-containing protein, partial [Verrucomicrobiales bacterium]